MKDKVLDDESKFNLNGLDRSIIQRDEADLLKLEDSSSCDLASRTSFQKIEPHQVILDDLAELSQGSNSSKTSNSRKRKFKNLQTAFDGPQKANSVTYKDLKRRKVEQPSKETKPTSAKKATTV